MEKNSALGKKTCGPLKNLNHNFPETFDGQVSLKLSPDAKPVQLPPRAVPLSIMPQQLKTELNKMEPGRIIGACPEMMKLVHNMVTAIKKDAMLALCLCLDPTNLNKVPHLQHSAH